MIISKKAISLAILVLFINLFASAQSRITLEEYVDTYKDIAIDHMEYYGIPASITMAQGVLESGCGNSLLSTKSNNHFGIKCKSNWTGRSVTHDDDEKGECFRAYDSVRDSYEDHAEFLDSSPRYDSLFAYSSADYRSWARGLKAAGYATAPDYADRLIRIIEDNSLYLLDKENGGKLYQARYHEAESKSEDNEEIVDNSSVEIVDPDNYRVTINAHNGYNVYRRNDVFYVLSKYDDTYASIGDAFDISTRHLRSFNDAKRGDLLELADVVYIGAKRTKWSESEPLEHTVEQGETLRMIAQRYAIKLSSLRSLNKLKRNAQPSAGDILKLK